MPWSKDAAPEAVDAEALAGRVRAALPAEGLSEQRMFGGIGFMLNGNLIAATSARGLQLRIGKDAYGRALTEPGVRAMAMRDRPVEGYVFIDPHSLDDAALQDWLQIALAFARSLPPKPSVAKPERTKAERK